MFPIELGEMILLDLVQWKWKVFLEVWYLCSSMFLWWKVLLSVDLAILYDFIYIFANSFSKESFLY